MDEIHLKPFFDYVGGRIVRAASNSTEAATTACAFMITSLFMSCPVLEWMLMFSSIRSFVLLLAEYCVHSVYKKLKCETCKENSICPESDVDQIRYSYSTQSISRGGLLYPDEAVVRMVRVKYIVITRDAAIKSINRLLVPSPGHERCTIALASVYYHF